MKNDFNSKFSNITISSGGKITCHGLDSYGDIKYNSSGGTPTSLNTQFNNYTLPSGYKTQDQNDQRYSRTNHTHDDRYSRTNHTHSQYMTHGDHSNSVRNNTGLDDRYVQKNTWMRIRSNQSNRYVKYDQGDNHHNQARLNLSHDTVPGNDTKFKFTIT